MQRKRQKAYIEMKIRRFYGSDILPSQKEIIHLSQRKKNEKFKRKTKGKMKMRTITLMLLLLSVFTSWADDETQRLVVWQKSGQKVFFDLTEEPETTFEGGKLVIRTSRTTVSYPLTSVLRYTYDGGTITDVGEAKMRPGEMRFMQNDNTMAFDGLPEGMRLDVYTLDGLKVKTVQAQDGQRTVISLADQPAGTYIVKAGDTTFKFLKR